MVRAATAEDTPVIAGMLHEFNLEFADPSPGVAVIEPRVRDFLEREIKFFRLAVDGEDVVGFAQISFHASIWSDGPLGFLDELYVIPDRRGSGFGRALMASFFDLAQERGASGLELTTGEDDVAARRLYESLGFVNQIEGAENSRSLFYELSFE